MKVKLKLFLTFLKIGAFTFGGGYAMIPLIQHEIVEKKKWLTDDEMIDMLTIAESTPGVIAVNSATFVGYKIGGFLGSLLATLGVILPSIFIITLIAMFFTKIMDNQYIIYAFKGIRAGVTVLILNAAIKIYRKTPKTTLAYLLIAFAFFMSIFIEYRYLTLSLIAFGLITGVISQMILRKESDEKNDIS
ncbi:MAG: chromate transporter [Bacilli bacterium]|nr:chromate transporter [Bacilli bacterium]MDD4076687.1 chromate transporter [Bacilli bacterium]MDD4388516.1 chromate transporter [Bacilli bacterium]